MAIYMWREWNYIPWANLAAYYPLTSSTTVYDKKTTTPKYTLTNSNNYVTFGVNQGVDCANFPTTHSWLYNNWSFYAFGTTNFTVGCWVYLQNTSTQTVQNIWSLWYNNGQIFILRYQSWKLRLADNSSLNYELNTFYAYTRNYIVITRESWTLKYYLNWTEWTIASWNTTNISQNVFGLWRIMSAWTYLMNWYMSNVIVDKDVWSKEDKDTYYNNTKSLYWIS